MIHMKELKEQISDLKARLDGDKKETRKTTSKRRQRQRPLDDLESDEGINIEIPVGHSTKSSLSPPSPALSADHVQDRTPDPDETEPEFNLPAPLPIAFDATHITSPSHASVASLLNTASTRRAQQIPSHRPVPPPQATNPTLPFPTPSPTSPFLTQHSSSMSDPSPFLAPLQNMSLFGGALNLDLTTSPSQSFDAQNRSPHSADKRDMPAEEAANLLLAFSSPDTLRPSGTTSKLAAATGGRGTERRSTLDSEDFSLDGGLVRDNGEGRANEREGGKASGLGIMGKTARDILRM